MVQTLSSGFLSRCHLRADQKNCGRKIFGRANFDWHMLAEGIFTVKLHYVVAPCLLLAVFIKPKTTHHYFNRIMWALCVYLEAVSVYPQLKLLQNLKVVTDTYTSHYVFALGVSRFFSCAHWVLQFVDREKDFIEALGSGIWPLFVVMSELTQTVILADFCWHYLKAMAAGSGTIRLPV